MMKTVAYAGTTLVGVSQDSLTYLDNEGRRCVIYFDECCINMRKLLGNGIRASGKHVGFRNSSASPAYVEIQTEPPTRFEFPKPERSTALGGTKFVPRTLPPGYGDFLGLLSSAGLATVDVG
jgi:hypothetical protein